jgi:hypothetical protein
MLSSTARTLARHATRRTALPTCGAVRNLNVHEYISMELMESHGIGVPAGRVADTPEEAEDIFNNILNKREWQPVIL